MNRSGRALARAMAVASTLALAAAGRAAQDAPDVDHLGPGVGDTVPAFSLPDQTGTVRSLESLMGHEGLMLVFSRSADW